MSTTESSATERTGTAGDVEMLARQLMGWPWIEEGEPLPHALAWSDERPFFYREHGYLMVGRATRPGLWNPFYSADDDVEVLERVREVWPVVAFEYNERQRFLETLPYRADAYTVGSFARAALAVLKQMEKAA